jgi:hypothetical protein
MRRKRLMMQNWSSIEVKMTQAQKRIREYLAEIGKRGGLASRRELTKWHARQMVAIREAKRAALKASVGRAATLRLDVDMLRREAGHGDRGSRQALAAHQPTRSQTAQTRMSRIIYRKPLTIDGCVNLECR